MALTLVAARRTDPSLVAEHVGLRADEVLPNDRYALCRDRIRQAIIALKRGRRVALGPNATLTFECRATALFQIQEVMWIEGRSGSEALAREIAAYACLVPPRASLRASLMIHGGSTSFTSATLAAGDRVSAGVEIDPGDSCDPVRYLGFDVDETLEERLGRGEPVHVRVVWGDSEVLTPLPRALVITLASELAGASAPSLEALASPSIVRGDASSPVFRSSNPVSENHHGRSGGPQGP